MTVTCAASGDAASIESATRTRRADCIRSSWWVMRSRGRVRPMWRMASPSAKRIGADAALRAFRANGDEGGTVGAIWTRPRRLNLPRSSMTPPARQRSARPRNSGTDTRADGPGGLVYYLKRLGPGLVTGAANDDPGAI